ncbi:MAG: UDP-3-O-[3-hydroxymyristoyl] N-acetylglucosamine deacetylase [Candidatus Tokpelaia sp. JSC085]|nr:MAG: UDP-3-O-[3-hydroxymyristoyl] N-acetylglucosamine deacetylase [Candidatus Tokpelaia sp. JSC085]
MLWLWICVFLLKEQEGIIFAVKCFQSTLEKEITFSGYGIHSGKPSTVVLKPAVADHGIIFFLRSEVGRLHGFPADVFHTIPMDFCTTLGVDNIRIETIEHLMAAIAASGLDNLAIEVSACELPILDGGAAFYMKAITEAGIRTQKVMRKYIRILEPIEIRSGDGFAGFSPSPSDAMRFDISIFFASSAIGRQHLAFTLDTDRFARDIAPARTFGFLKDVETLWAAGLALGSSLENSVVIGLDDRVLNAGGLIAADEFVRHKALDAVGDTALLGWPFIGIFYSFKGGHRLNAQAVRALLENPRYYEMTSFRS